MKSSKSKDKFKRDQTKLINQAKSRTWLILLNCIVQKNVIQILFWLFGPECTRELTIIWKCLNKFTCTNSQTIQEMYKSWTTQTINRRKI